MKVITLLAVSLFASGAFGQAKNAPTPTAMYISSDGTGNPGTWVPESGTGGTALPHRVPPAVGAYCSNDGTGNAGTWVPCPASTATGTISSITSTGSTIVVTNGTGPTTNLEINTAKALTWTANGALSAPAVLYNGTPVTTGGSSTTTWPLFLLQPSGTTSNQWNSAGTMFGVNAASGFTGSLIDLQINGTSRLNLTSGGTLTVGIATKSGGYFTSGNCLSAASPAVCGSSAAGSVAVPTGTTFSVLTVNTTAVTANSQILLTVDDTLGTRLGVTCNSTLATLVGGYFVSARTAGSSFTITFNGTIAINPVCMSYTIIN
jgi:hypothetical protein